MFVQAVGFEQDTAGTTTPAPSATYGAGNTVVVFVTMGGNPTITVADGTSNVYKQVGANQFDAGNNQCVATFIADAVVAGTRVVTASHASETFRAIEVLEFSGRANPALDQGPGYAAATAANPSSASVTPSQFGADAAGFVETGGSGLSADTARGWKLGATHSFALSEYRENIPVGSPLAATFVAGSGGYIASIITLLPAQPTVPAPFLTR